MIERCLGSAKVIIGKTEVIASIKAKLSKPDLDAPDKGLFKISLFWYAYPLKIFFFKSKYKYLDMRGVLRVLEEPPTLKL